MYITKVSFLNFNFGESRITTFTKEDLQKEVDNNKTVEEIASKFSCSISTVKRRAKEWGIRLFYSINGKEEIFIPYEVLLRTNEPDVRIEDVCAEYGCSRKTLNIRKKEFGIPAKQKKKVEPLSEELYKKIYSGNVEKNIKANGLTHGSFYRKLHASELSTPLQKSLEAAKKIDFNEIKKMREQGMRTKQIADYYHVNPSTIRRHERKAKN